MPTIDLEALHLDRGAHDYPANGMSVSRIVRGVWRQEVTS